MGGTPYVCVCVCVLVSFRFVIDMLTVTTGQEQGTAGAMAFWGAVKRSATRTQHGHRMRQQNDAR